MGQNPRGWHQRQTAWSPGETQDLSVGSRPFQTLGKLSVAPGFHGAHRHLCQSHLPATGSLSGYRRGGPSGTPGQPCRVTGTPETLLQSVQCFRNPKPSCKSPDFQCSVLFCFTYFLFSFLVVRPYMSRPSFQPGRCWPELREEGFLQTPDTPAPAAGAGIWSRLTPQDTD